MTNVGIITQARTTSTRLPGKVLLEAAGKTFLDHHLDRLATAGHEVFVATTTNDTDDAIVSLADHRGLRVHRGSETDVLQRFHDCAVAHDLDVIVRVTSDCPLIDGSLVRSAVKQYLQAGDPDLYLSNTVERTYPRGFEFEVFSARSLAEAHRRATSASDREHVTPYLYTGPNPRARLENLSFPTDRSSYRVTLDTPEDLEVLTTLIERHRAAQLSCAEIVKVLDDHPDLVAINAHVRQKPLAEAE